ncbi:hypothetical protein [Bacillus badius]|uniref:ParM/StbA family protein n=1 Tax=Bacillus badius TaxID=1455 RepID=UPI0007B3AAB9|nr:hypothetical protein [Bacillus badius]KZR59339.1 hypothetical protein A3781_13135 [Bacillus badius]
MAKEKVIVAVDLGNGYTKVVASLKNNKVKFVMPSGFLYKSRVATDDFGIGNDLNNEYFVISSNNPNPTVYLWDDKVNKSSEFESLIGGENRYESIEYQMFFSMVLSEVANRLGVDGNNIDFYVITGVPSDQKGSELENKLKQAVLNSPTISAKGKEFSPSVAEVEVVAQPIGTVFNELLDDEGIPYDEEEFEEHTIATIDIGTGTTDGEVIKDRKSLLNQRFTEDVGMFDVYDNVVDCIRKDTGSAVPFANVELQFDKDDFKISKRKYVPIKEAKEKSIQETFDIIRKTMNTKWRNQSRFDRIILTGGGASIFYPLFKEAGYDVEMSKNNQLANAEGFYKLGLLVFEDEEEE